MSATVVCVQAAVSLFNFLFFLIGVTLLTFGSLLMSGEKTLAPLLAGALRGLSGLSTQPDVTSSPGVSTTVDKVATILEIFHNVALALIVVGVFVILLSFLGMFGPCCMNNNILVFYLVMIILVLLTHFAVFLCIILGAFAGKMRAAMFQAIDRYEGIEGEATYSVAWNYVMVNYECCGVDNYTEFNQAKKWKRYRIIDGEERYLVTPLACCKLEGELSEGKAVSSDCSYAPTDVNNNWKKGCWEALHEKEFIPNLATVTWVTLIVILIESMVIGCTIFLVIVSTRSGTDPSMSKMLLVN